MKAVAFRPSLTIFVALVASIPAVAAPAGLPNFHEVNDKVYRGGQPFNSGWAALSKMGIDTVVDLRRENEDGEHSIREERNAVEGAGMRFVSVPMNGIVSPTDEQISKVLAILNSGQHVFVHCKMGMDRTGTVIAAYRMTHDGWDNKKALKEAKSLGLHWYEVGMKRYIENFQGAEQLADSSAAVGALARP